ncbi:MAG: ABC transporter transmembrane domain-containing protein [Syntrophobacterales bacterium]|nr:ABC transporter transmembrane domain-containing protein [Syntrophobacterales bacterium]
MKVLSHIGFGDQIAIKRFIEILRPYKKLIILSVFCMAGFSAFTALTAYIIRPVMDDVFFNKDLRRLFSIPFLILLVFFIKGLFQWGSDYFLQAAGLSIVSDLRAKLFSHLTFMPVSFFDNQSGGELLSRITNDVQEIQEAVSRAVTGLVRDVFTILGLTVVIFYQNWQLALIAMGVLPIAFCPLFVFGKLLRKFAHKSQQAMAKLASIIHETFRGVRIVKAFCREDHEIKKFSNQNREFLHYAKKLAFIDAMASPLMECIGAIGVAAIVGYGGYQVITGKATPGTFFSFIGAIILIYRPVKSLSRINTYLQRGLASLERVYSILGQESQRAEIAPTYLELPSIRGGVEFRNVSFSYDGTTRALSNVSFSVEPGEVIALVGPSGSGKTTLVNLIARFYDPLEGVILIDGQDIRRFTYHSLRRNVAIVTQQNFLFNDTVRNNIAYGKEGAQEYEIIEAARLAYAYDFIMQLPDGLDTIVGEQGIKLSGGEQQRICIARAILKNAPILIMDEATSSLDSEAEKEVQRALENLMAGRTTFIIAHRLSTVQRASRIFVMSGGKIVEEGRHEELISSGGLYRRLYELQYGKAFKLNRTAEALELHVAKGN